jgi:PleD family two-component response regulator
MKKTKTIAFALLLGFSLCCGVLTINLDTNSLMLFYDDERTDEEAVKKILDKAGFPVTRMMLLKEPREGVMN